MSIWTDKSAEKSGEAYTRGAIKAIIAQVICLLVIWFGFQLSRNIFAWGLDDSDKSAWERSGFSVMIDHKTGLEYLSDGKGGLILRQSACESDQ